jgi:WD40 repeat protein/tetratricopeptide (TPR) repeat protein/tRNA A-37 threonylcarbamoyl transferase component Bud32
MSADLTDSDVRRLPERCQGMAKTERLRALCGDQSLRWERGRPVPVEQYLEAFPDLAADPHDALPLIVGEWLQRLDRGDPPRLSDYQRRFPNLADELARQFELHMALARGQTLVAGPAPAAAAPPDLPGYVILGALGRGGMGVVYKARQKSLNRVVAIKTVLPGAHVRPEHLVRFRQEGELLARVQHPNIVQVYESGAAGGLCFLVMEFVDGPSLAQHCGGLPRPPDEAARLVEALARAVGYAHRQGVVHRDIKPGNVLLTSAGVPKLTDFGLAKHLGAGEGVTATGDVFGTPAYMAPEQALGHVREVGPAADVYALGATLYELLTGRPPFQGETPLDVLRRVAGEEPSSVRHLRPGVPRDLETICLKCLRKEPAKRYATADALAEDLHRFQTGRPITARRVSAPERLWRWARRHPGVATLLFALILTLTVGVAVATVLAVAEREAARTAEGRRQEAEGARQEARRQLWQSMLNEARGIRLSGRRGQRFEALAKLKEALALARELGELSAEDRKRFSDEASACLMLVDLEVEKEWDGWPAGSGALAFDAALEHYARYDANDHSMSLRRVADDREIARLPGQGKPSDIGMRFSPDGRWFARCTESSGAVEVWRVDDSGATPAWATGGGWQLQFSPDGARLAVTFGADTAGLFETASGRLLKHLPGAVPGPSAFHPNRPQLAVLKGQALRVIDLTTDKVVTEIPCPSKVASVAWHPHGRLLAVSSEDLLIRLYDASTGQPVLPALQGHKTFGIHLAFEPSGELLASTDWSGMLRLWDVRSGWQVFSCPGCALGAGTRFGTGRPLLAAEVRGQQLRLLRLPSRHMKVLASDSDFFWCAFSPSGRRLACSVWDTQTLLLDLPSATLLARLPGGVPLAFDPSGTSVVTMSARGFHRWAISADPPTGAPRVGPPLRWLAHRRVWFVGLSRDCDVVAIPNFDEGARVGCLRPPQRWVATEPQRDVRRCAVSPDGRWVVTGSHLAGSVIVSEAATGRRVKQLCADGGEGQFSPDGRWLAVSPSSGGAQLWRVEGWQPAGELPGKPCAFTRDGAMVAVAGSFGEVHLIACDTGREVARLEAPAQTRLEPVGFTPDGGDLVTRAPDLTLLLAFDLRGLRADLKPLGLDWEWPDFPPERAPADPAGAPTPWQVVGAELLKDPAKMAVHQRDQAVLTLGFAPFDAEAHARLGAALLALGQYEDAYRRLSFALGLRPDLLEARDERARAAFRTGRWFGTVGDVTAVLARDPFNEELLWWRAMALQHLGLHGLAVRDFDSSARNYPNSASFRLDRARSYEVLGRHTEAAADRKKAVELAPDDPAILNDVAWSLAAGPEARRDPKRAAQLARRAADRSPKHAHIRHTLGVALYRDGRYRDAVAELDRSLELGKGSVDAYCLYFLAMCHHRLGNAVRAKECLEGANRWVEERKQLAKEERDELRRFRTEAEHELNSPPPPGSP